MLTLGTTVKVGVWLSSHVSSKTVLREEAGEEGLTRCKFTSRLHKVAGSGAAAFEYGCKVSM